MGCKAVLKWARYAAATSGVVHENVFREVVVIAFDFEVVDFRWFLNETQLSNSDRAGSPGFWISVLQPISDSEVFSSNESTE